MHGVEGDRVFLGVGSALRRTLLVGPRGGHGFGEGTQPAHREGAAQAEEEVDVRESPLRLPAVSAQQRRSDAQDVDRL